MKTRNSEVLASFVAYCNANPSLRFWQALLNWSGLPFILISDKPVHEVNACIRDPFAPRVPCLTDPYNYEGRNG